MSIHRTRALDVILREINALVEGAASGTYFFDNRHHSGWIRLREGNVEQLTFDGHLNDDALPLLLTGFNEGTGRFVPGPVLPGRQPLPKDAAIRRWLAGELTPKPATAASSAQSVAAARPATNGGPAHQPTHRLAIEQVALNFFGPIATVLCREAWTAHAEVERALSQIAMNLSDEVEKRRFLAESRAALTR